MTAPETICAFVTGELPIEAFADRFTRDESIRAWLDGVIDRVIRDNLPIRRREDACRS